MCCLCLMHAPLISEPAVATCPLPYEFVIPPAWAQLIASARAALSTRSVYLCTIAHALRLKMSEICDYPYLDSDICTNRDKRVWD